MKVQVLGVGNAFCPELGNSSIIIWDNSSKGLLIDCGYTVYPILKKKNLLDKIDRVFITHKHGDHTGSLDTFLYHKRFLLKQKVTFYGVANYAEYLKMIDPGFEKDRDQYFVKASETIDSIPTEHQEGALSWAFADFGVLYSGDTSRSLLDTSQAFDAKVILHEVSFSKSNAHTDFTELAKAADKIKRKTWLYHYAAGEEETQESKVRLHGFAGFLKKDQIIGF